MPGGGMEFRGSTMMRMVASIALDYVVGVIPLAGDAFDVVRKANEKNVARQAARIGDTGRGRRARIGDWFVLAGLVVVWSVVLVGAVSVAFWIWSAIFHWLFS